MKFVSLAFIGIALIFCGELSDNMHSLDSISSTILYSPRPGILRQ